LFPHIGFLKNWLSIYIIVAAIDGKPLSSLYTLNRLYNGILTLIVNILNIKYVGTTIHQSYTT